jgi:hypothetical protein
MDQRFFQVFNFLVEVIDFSFKIESWNIFFFFTLKFLYDKHSGGIAFHIFRFTLHFVKKILF